MVDRIHEVAEAVISEPMVPASTKDLARVWRNTFSVDCGIKVINALMVGVRDGIARPLQAAVRFILACQGSPEDARAVGIILLNQAVRAEGLSERERRRRMRQSLGWFGYCAGSYYECENQSLPNMADLASYDIGGRLEELLISEPSDKIGARMLGRVRDQRRKKDDHVALSATGHSTRLVDKDAMSLHQEGPDHPAVHIGVIAKKIVDRLPQAQSAARAVIEAPTDFSKGWDLVFALRTLDLEGFDAREEIEAVVMSMAYAGNQSACMQAAVYAIGRAYHGKPNGSLVERALGWLSLASGARPIPEDAPFNEAVDDVIEIAGGHLASFIKPAIAPAASPLSNLKQPKDAEENDADPAALEAEWGELFEVNVDLVVGGEQQDLPDLIDDAVILREPFAVRPVKSIGKLSAKDEITTRAVLGVLMRPLALKPAPRDLEAWRRNLLQEFPHAGAAIDAWHADMSAAQMAGKRAFRLKPTLLVGPPGTGKTRLARRLAETAKVPFVAKSAAGIADSMIGGMARGYSSSHPAMPLCALRDTKVANPVLLVDEIEKASGSRHNGSLWDSVISMLEPETSKAWPDPFVQAPCDISWISWVLTANGLVDLPAPLRDRVRIVTVPAPEVSHVPALAASVLADLAAEAQHPGWLQPLDGEELAVLQERWGNRRSLRLLRRMVEALIAERDRAAPRN